MSQSVQLFRFHIKKRIEITSSNRSCLQEKLGSDIQDNISVLIKQIRKLKQTEKFWRYAHNLHLENCKKYHKRIANLDLEHIEDLAELEGSIQITILDEFGKPLRYEKNSSHAYQNICEQIKEDNERREKVINYVKKMIS